ncbi:helix-turn-helix transcriptional regulator [Dactylosporangium matsuzakiense]|uniref:DNA-binding transcriptional regulator YafY n=1 Tax=Dactylosporangium matsuzakiense TaxID=53360 RepID=A0A9W6KYB3_9ACTN|nr:transcriptional regulator [Dactylosporangium matsuzakiense]UWZ43983.1 transcriptional regulator [Dactylosporangium matsuzakiense]GLL08660.1 hypothetical protein GCM10017581_104270 [Dactylosporangium matsuzakiense]
MRAGRLLSTLLLLQTRGRLTAQQIADELEVSVRTVYRDPEAPPHLEAVATAVWEQQRIRISYCKWDGESVERPLAPLGLVLKGTAWYLVATGRTRTNAFRVARIAAVTVLDEHFERPADFDLRQYWGSFAERLEETLYSGGSATVRLSPRAVRLWFLLGPVAGRALRDSAEPEAGGWVRVVLPIQSIEHARVDFGRFGADIEVLEPAELRAAMRATAEAMTRRYSAP